MHEVCVVKLSRVPSRDAEAADLKQSTEWYHDVTEVNPDVIIPIIDDMWICLLLLIAHHYVPDKAHKEECCARKKKEDIGQAEVPVVELER